MKKKFTRILVSLVLAITTALLSTGTALADTSQNVTVTGTPSYISIANAPATWTINDITGSGVIETTTTYYANLLGDTTIPSEPIVDGECNFTITNTSTVATDLVTNFPHFTGGDAMQNSDDGTAGVGEFGAFSWVSGVNYSTGKVIAKNTASVDMIDGLAATTNIKWGLTVLTQTDVWASPDDMTSVVVVTASAD